ncbi:MAG: hypothetical protein IJW40_11700 [Clostridia bacterium]|nr:hypothetical protein [Clostridia bacterium]MBQ7339099.1 hypothetical protein [Clostridia bacterium]
MKKQTSPFPKSYIVKVLLCILLPAVAVLLLVVLIGLFELPEELFLVILLLWTAMMAVLGRLIMKWHTRVILQEELSEKGAELPPPEEQTPLFAALAKEYMENDLRKLTYQLQPLGWTADGQPLDCDGTISVVYTKGEHDVYIEFSNENIKVIFDEGIADIEECAELTKQRFLNTAAIYTYIAELCNHYFM